MNLVRALDELYRAVCLGPETWSDEALEAWAGDVVLDHEPLPRIAARQLRAGVRAARRLRNAQTGPTSDWRAAVDDALGSEGWAPSLELATIGLEADPSPELFEEVRARFRMVHFEPWQEGVSFEEWRLTTDS